MKILCIQLARFGDICQTIPVLNGLVRKHPNAKIDFLVRKKFAAACMGLPSNVNVLEFQTEQFLKPVLGIDCEPNVTTALATWRDWITGVHQKNYDQIINLSFSPLSSYMVQSLRSEHTVVRGYDRHSDGFLNIADDFSAYFYSQVGVDKWNRIHLTDIFGFVAGVELEMTDFKLEGAYFNEPMPLAGSLQYGVIHAGASDLRKTLTLAQWEEVVSQCLETYSGHIVLVGTDSERLSSTFLQGHLRVIDVTGKTSLAQSAQIIKEAEFLIGGDSLHVQIASLTQTRTLNLSCPIVRFWETGPRAPGSRILHFDDLKTAHPETIARELNLMLKSEPSEIAIIRDYDFGVLYSSPRAWIDEFQWALLCRLYFGDVAPIELSPTLREAVEYFVQLTTLAMQQIDKLSEQPTNSAHLQLLDQSEQMMAQLVREVGILRPILNWIETEKSRIPPKSFSEITRATRMIYQKLNTILVEWQSQNVIQDEFTPRGLDWK